jgi:hypothetical protein
MLSPTSTEPIIMKPAEDVLLQNLKLSAEKGNGDKGPIYEKGILDLIAEIETNGNFDRKGITGILKLMHDNRGGSKGVLTPEEEAAGQQFLSQHGWTVEQGNQYADGVISVQAAFPQYAKKS